MELPLGASLAPATSPVWLLRALVSLPAQWWCMEGQMRWWVLEHLENCKETPREGMVAFNGLLPPQLLFWGVKALKVM